MDVYLYCFVFYFGGKFPLYYHPPSSDILLYPLQLLRFFTSLMVSLIR